VANRATKKKRRALRIAQGADLERVPSTKRNRVFARSGFACAYCGSRHSLTLDHIETRSAGGGNEEWNLVAACSACNNLRGNMSISKWLRMCREHGMTPSVTLESIAQLRQLSGL